MDCQKVSHARSDVHPLCVLILRCMSLYSHPSFPLFGPVSRGFLYSGLPMPASSRTCWDAWRRRQVGLWLGSRRQARQMRHILFRSASTLHAALAGCVLNPSSFNSIGINGESSFERSLLRRAPGCEVWGYDFSVKSVRVPCPCFY
jgi:hypothetical protein